MKMLLDFVENSVQELHPVDAIIIWQSYRQGPYTFAAKLCVSYLYPTHNHCCIIGDRMAVFLDGDVVQCCKRFECVFGLKNLFSGLFKPKGNVCEMCCMINKHTCILVVFLSGFRNSGDHLIECWQKKEHET